MALPNCEQSINVLKLLEIHEYFPKKITREMALTVPGEVIKQKDLDHPGKLPWFMLQNIMSGNYKGISFEINTQDQTQVEQSDLWEDEDQSTGNEVNPLDVLTSLFICCDDFLRQILVEKLSNCQLGIPLLLPVIDASPRTSGVEMLSWATSTIRKQWKTISGPSFEQSMAVHPLPIVSALRIGRPKLSKSKTLNGTINSRLDHFFHSKCTGGNAQKVISNGVVELMWYLPVGSDEDNFPGAFGIMNLRGNVVNHSLQKTFMIQASSVNVIFCQSDMSNKKEMDVISSWNDQQSHLILVFDGTPTGEWKKTVEDVYTTYKKKNMVKVITNSDRINLTEKLRQVLKEWMPAVALSGQNTSKSLEGCEVIASHVNIRIDEKDNGENYDCKLRAIELFKCLEKENTKDENLPLQAISRDITKKTREKSEMKFKDIKSTELYIEKLTSEITSLREKQLVAWKDKSQMIMVKQFLKSVAFTPLGRSYFYTWTGTMLDRNSIHQLQLIREKNTLCANEVDSVIIDKFQHEIFNASLGLVHINREIAQIYEMASGLSKMESEIQKYPEIAAGMLIDGHPLEIIDGDARHVPVTWLKEVFNCLYTKIGNKKVFVLSIVGVQGSGKSTMLNTMFGLKFAVGAGRCTKGAFAQLVPLDKDLCDRCKCDYIMVVDTEGLFASECAEIGHSTRDKESATFIIGLADCTIINFEGDNRNGIQEILQIAVYALMKMKLTNLKPSCIFVHQHTSDLMTSNKNLMGGFKMKGILDEATQIAASEQGKSFKSFEDVISFQPEKHVVYIQSLWHGIPPMATRNPEYIRNVLELRKLVFSVMKERNSISIEEFSLKFTGVSEAVLYEDFAFSFVHAVEMKSYNALETEYIQASRHFRRTCMSNCLDFINVCRAIPAKSIEEEGKKMLQNYRENLQQSYTTMCNRMELYIRKNPKAAQWSVQFFKKQYKLESDMVETLTSEFNIAIGKGKYLQEIKRKSSELAKELREAGKSDLELETQFNTSLNKWIKDIPSIEHIHIETTLEEVFIETFPKETTVINDTLRRIKKQKSTKDDLKGYNFEARRVLSKANENAKSAIKRYRNERSNCNKSVIKEVVDEVYETLDPSNKRFFSRQELAKHTCFIIWKQIREFEILRRDFKDHNDPRALLLRKKGELVQAFKTECKVKQPLTATEMFLSLNDATEKAINIQFFENAVEYFNTSPDHKHIVASKKSFHAKMLIDLAETDSFELAKGYLLNPSFRMSCWVQEYILNALQGKVNDNETMLQNMFYNCVRGKYQEVLVATTNACTNVGPKCKGNKLWQEINSKLKPTRITPVIISEHIANDEIQVETFQDKLRSKLDSAEDNLLKRDNVGLVKDLRFEIGKVIEYFEKDLIGCVEECPFCGAPCDNIAGCTTHQTECHRPQGIAGQNWHWWNWTKKCEKELVIELCTTSVADTKLQFKKNDVDNKWHKYQEYRTVYESWSIPPIVDTTTQLYWKWFMANYNTELAKLHGCKEAQIPDSWKQIKWEAARQDLINLYNPRT